MILKLKRQGLGVSAIARQTDNAYIEAFNGCFRAERLNATGS
jgi:hypothetical protein